MKVLPFGDTERDRNGAWQNARLDALLAGWKHHRFESLHREIHLSNSLKRLANLRRRMAWSRHRLRASRLRLHRARAAL